MGIFFALLPLIFSNFSYLVVNATLDSNCSENRNLDYENLKISKISGPIHINNNWSAAKAEGICSGNGTFSEPYVLEDLVIDSEVSGSCILIENSEEYFKIENCTIYNSGVSYPNSGISLRNVTNAQLIDNKCSSNYNGIHLNNSYNNTISENTANSNKHYGITLGYSDNNTISGNTASNNYYGIGLSGGDYNTI